MHAPTLSLAFSVSLRLASPFEERESRTANERAATCSRPFRAGESYINSPSFVCLSLLSSRVTDVAAAQNRNPPSQDMPYTSTSPRRSALPQPTPRPAGQRGCEPAQPQPQPRPARPPPVSVPPLCWNLRRAHHIQAVDLQSKALSWVSRVRGAFVRFWGCPLCRLAPIQAQPPPPPSPPSPSMGQPSPDPVEYFSRHRLPPPPHPHPWTPVAVLATAGPPLSVVRTERDVLTGPGPGALAPWGWGWGCDGSSCMMRARF
ncbi:hypothetical protein MPTK1_8g17260 [Marchantia polymorpha subsp. ruderalis]|uniref:Uncharacterized protein n=1 Tax=Marchantia polymorpha TaxID=3197 RepID=A0A2R6X882_MARPO|nr:hypothetical protein MARPO_0030s0060 [Marchantia polymorpha]BBN20197.1 hypothetical protein Mp_8g17260 [Marchantia polymorpha subsp. ruderalis]|eukprot:PTQ42315.1 hypothetical protein MARPO_0030s0060 [Marchantia polymorpha]